MALPSRLGQGLRSIDRFTASRHHMGLFNADLFRAFAVGFVLGAIGLCVVMGSAGDNVSDAMVPHAIAAPARSN